MKKIIIGILLIVISIIIYKQLIQNDLSKANKLSESGDYKGFYSEIKSKHSNNKSADLLLTNYFLKAIQEKNFKEVRFYLNKDKKLIEKTNENGDRAIDIVLFDENVNIEMLKLLLSYKPNLNYVVSFYDMTPLQVVVTQSEHSLQNLEALKLLIQHGADVNYYTEKGKSEHSTLAFSFVMDNLKAFEMLLQNGAVLTNAYINNDKEHKNDILSNIIGSYVIYLKNQQVNLSNFYNKPLSYKTRSMIDSTGYKILHDKNMKYLKSISKYSSLTKASEEAKEAIAKWFIKTKEYSGLKFLAENKVFKEKMLYKKIKIFSLKENDRTAIHILNQYKGI